jgi:hypothetical protein
MCSLSHRPQTPDGHWSLHLRPTSTDWPLCFALPCLLLHISLFDCELLYHKALTRILKWRVTLAHNAVAYDTTRSPATFNNELLSASPEEAIICVMNRRRRTLGHLSPESAPTVPTIS